MQKTWLGLFIGMTLLAGCATVGREFPVASGGNIIIGETDREEILRKFGDR